MVCARVMKERSIRQAYYFRPYVELVAEIAGAALRSQLFRRILQVHCVGYRRHKEGYARYAARASICAVLANALVAHSRAAASNRLSVNAGSLYLFRIRANQ